MTQHQHEPTAADWDRLRSLCRRAGLAAERVDRLEKSWSATPLDGGVTILAGRLETLSLVLARRLGLKASKALADVNDAALVIGRKPETVQPSLGEWPGLVHRDWGQPQRHVIAVPSSGPLTPTLRSALGSLPVADQILLLSRLSQPFSQDERRLAASLSPFAATARAVFVALPSEEGTEAERAELAAYGLAQLESQGFRGRSLGAGVWYTEEPRPADTIQTLDDWLAARPGDVTAGRNAARRMALSDLLADIEKGSDGRGKPEKTLSAIEADELGHKFAHHVADLGRRLGDLADAGEFLDTEACRRYAVESLQGWTKRTSLEGVFFDYAESLRSGIKAELTEQAPAIADLLRYEPPPQSRPKGRFDRGLFWTLAVAAASGAAAYLAVYLMGSPFLQTWFLIVLANLGATAAAIAGFIISGHHLPRPRQGPAEAESAGPSPLPGWASAEQRLTNWFDGRIRSQTPTLRQECLTIRSQFQLEGGRS